MERGNFALGHGGPFMVHLLPGPSAIQGDKASGPTAV
jgi:hypothetical protein